MKKWFQATVFRYFISYFLIFCISVVGMFLLFRAHLVKTLTEQYTSQIQAELSSAASHLTDEINTLFTINTQVIGNADVMMAKYVELPGHTYQLQSELKKYVIGKPLIRSVGYIDKKHDELYAYSSADYLSYEDGVVTVNTLGGSLSFRPGEYHQNSANQLIHLRTETISRFVYLPVCFDFYNYSVFFVLNDSYMEDACRSLLSDTVAAAALIAPDESVTVSAWTDRSAKRSFPVRSDDGEVLYLSDSFCGGYRLAALYSEEPLKLHIARAIEAGMPGFLLIAFAGFALVVLFTFSTYHPLHRLAHKFSGENEAGYDLLRHLDRAIESQQTQNDNLKTRIEHYRTIMQKMLLDTMLVNESAEEISGQDIDAYFLLPEQHFIAAFAVGAEIPKEDIFSQDDHALMLRQSEKGRVFLVNRVFDKEVPHESTLLAIAERIYEKSGAFVGVSDTTSSAMDIPSLAEQAQSALASAGEEQPAVLWLQTDTSAFESRGGYQYPHELLHQFSKSLSAGSFSAAGKALGELLDLLSGVRAPLDALPDFFVRSVLIDILSDLAIQMDNTGVRFREYEDLYFRALYLCRSCSFHENEADIRALFSKMLEIFESFSGSIFPNADKIRKIVEENIANPDFSISVLYAGHDISLAYMSSLFKKETGENFSDYLWNVRYKKALELLETGEMNINDISLAVGYLHPSSFRRKFKQETGASPTDYLTGHN